METETITMIPFLAAKNLSSPLRGDAQIKIWGAYCDDNWARKAFKPFTGEANSSISTYLHFNPSSRQTHKIGVFGDGEFLLTRAVLSEDGKVAGTFHAQGIWSESQDTERSLRLIGFFHSVMEAIYNGESIPGLVQNT